MRVNTLKLLTAQREAEVQKFASHLSDNNVAETRVSLGSLFAIDACTFKEDPGVAASR